MNHASAPEAMVFSGNGLLVLFHVLFASLWFGGAVYQVSIIGMALMEAGPKAMGFSQALVKRGGIGKYFMVNGGLTILFGGALYGQEMSSGKLTGAFEGAGLWITLGAILAVLAYLHGLTATFPIERKWMAFVRSLNGPPSPEQAEKLQAFGMKLGKNSAMSAGMVAAAFLLMLLSRVFP